MTHSHRNRFGRIATTAALVAGAGLAAVMLVPAALGFDRYVITGKSMTGSHDKGSLLFAKEVATSDLRVGDVITYDPPAGSGPDGLVTHRIVAVDRRPDGELAFRTKGDANDHADPWKFTLGETQTRAVFDIPYVGYAFAALDVRAVRMLLIGLPAALIALMMLARLWQDAGREARRRAEVTSA
jgi:signal peptidase I